MITVLTISTTNAMMLLWFILIGVGIIVVFHFIGKASDVFNHQELERQNDIRDRWYEERDKAVEELEREINDRRH